MMAVPKRSAFTATDGRAAQPLTDDASIIEAMQRWVRRAVIGLKLCPFAKSVESHGQVRYIVSRQHRLAGILEDLEREACCLQRAEPALHDTTLLILAEGQAEFLEFHFTVGEAERRLRALKLDGELQLASFHPHYVFADAQPDDIGNYTNRAPWPTLHLLREASIDKAVAAIVDPAEIYERNMQTLRALGAAGWERLMQDGAPEGEFHTKGAA